MELLLQDNEVSVGISHAILIILTSQVYGLSYLLSHPQP